MAKKTALKKNNEMSEQLKTKHPTVWLLKGFWGLKITDDIDGLEQPLFGDATFLSTERASELVTSASEDKRRALGGLGLGDLPNMANVEIPQHVRKRPDSFIAVRRSSDRIADSIASANTRIERLLAALVGQHIMGSGRGIAISTNLLDHTNWIELLGVVGSRGEFLQGRATMASGSIEPTNSTLEIKKSDLSASLNTGQLLDSLDDTWSTNKNLPLMKLVARPSKMTGWQRQILDAIVFLSSAIHEANADECLVKAVSAYEMLLSNQSNFDLLRSRIAALLLSPDESHHTEEDPIGKIFAARHNFVHQGKRMDDKLATLRAGMACQLGFVLASACAELASVYPNKQSLIDAIDSVIAVEKMSTPPEPALEMRELLGLQIPETMSIISNS